MFTDKINKKIDQLIGDLNDLKLKESNGDQIVVGMQDLLSDLEKFEENIEEFKGFIESGITFLK